MNRIRRLLSLFFPQRRTAAALSVTAVATAIAATASPFLAGFAVDLIRDDGSGDLSALFGFLAVLAVVYTVSALSRRILSVLAIRLSFRTGKHLRDRAFERLQHLPLSFFDRTPRGEILSRLTNDIDILTDGVSQGVVQLSGGILTLIGSLIFMLILNPVVALVIAVMTPISVLIAAFITSRSQRQFREQALYTGRLSALTEEAVSGMKTIKQFRQEEETAERFRDLNRKLYFCGRDAQFYGSLTNPTTRLVNNTAYAAVAVVGGLLALHGGLSVGQIAGFLTYAIQFAKPINEMTAVLYQLQAAGTAAERIFELIDRTPQMPDACGARRLPAAEGAVNAENVSFAYTPDKPLIRNLNFSVKPGQVIAIVGPTGAGKTTLINLLMRFYEIDAGTLSLDRVPLSDYRRSALRSSFSMVLQETWLFKGTVIENLVYGRPEATAAEAEEAARLSGADEFIRKLPHGYNSLIEEDGGNLSQGERQILTIARALLKPAPLLILDEATSNVDTRTELKIQAAFLHLMKNKTCFVIAHRLSTIRSADLILVMDNGDVVEQGTHSELLAKNGLYARLYRQSS